MSKLWYADIRILCSICECGLLALYRQKETLVNSSLKATKNKKKMARVILKIQVSHPGPSWPSCFTILKKNHVATSKLSYANAFNFDKTIMCFCVYKLTLYKTTKFWTTPNWKQMIAADNKLKVA